MSHVHAFTKDGFVFLHGILSWAELRIIDGWLKANCDFSGGEAVRTREGDLQAIYGLHRLLPGVLGILRNPQLRRMIVSLLGSRVYLYQSQLHLKPRSSEVLDWHQDFRTYHVIDGLPEPHGLIIGIFLDEIASDMAPVEVVPGSHAQGLLPSALSLPVPATGPSAISEGQGDEPRKYAVSEAVLKRQTAYPQVIKLTGAPGSVFFLHPCLVHRSAINNTGRRRAILYTNLFACRNTPRNKVRPECVVARDFSPVW